MTAQEWLDRADALAAAATDGPWGRFQTHVGGVNIVGPRPDYKRTLATVGPDADAAFIAASRTLVPDMSAALRAVLDLHGQDPFGGTFCSHDGEAWPCPTIRWINCALDGAS